VTTGKQIGSTEILLNSHTPLSRDEVAEAAEFAREKSRAVQELLRNRDKSTVHWEYLQLFISRKHGPNDPGDRVARFVFTASAAKDQPALNPVRVIVNLTKSLVLDEAR
jgi:hypothetical protein